MQMVIDRSIYIYRNYTIEPLFKDFSGIRYSGYEDISIVPDDVSLYIWFYSFPVNESDNETIEKLNDFKHKLDLVLLRSKPSSYFLLFTLSPVCNFSFQSNKKKISESIATYNQYLYSLADSRSLTKVIDFDDFIRLERSSEIIDWRYFFMFRTLINPSLSTSFSIWFRRQWMSIEGKRKKCLILDLDNTLWGGILGEDGIEGIQLGNSYPGNCYKTFQKMLLEAVKYGVILSIVSKNNEDEVWKAFEDHPDMLLKKGDFIAWRINWNDKASNISEIADELNIGLDSIVFIDDSPTERDWINKALPEVIVPEFPKQSYQLIAFFQDVYSTYFQLHDLTMEDQEKLLQYKTNSLRNQSRKSFSNIEEYIASLGIGISVREADYITIPRIAQLTQKTNQFNLTTHRYTEADITSMTNEGYRVYSASVTDKFGDNGITAVCILKNIAPESVEIDTYLLSCRILGKYIEVALIKYLLNKIYESGTTEVFACYVPTTKNSQTALFYDNLGFEVFENEPSKKYHLKIKERFEIEPYYRFV